VLNYFLPTMKLESKERVGSKVVRKYGETMTPLRRVLACAEVSAPTRSGCGAEQRASNPFALTREVERQMKVISNRTGGERKLDWSAEGIKRSPPRNGNEGRRTATVPGFLRFQFQGALGNTILSQPEHFPVSPWVTPTFELRRGGAQRRLFCIQLPVSAGVVFIGGWLLAGRSFGRPSRPPDFFARWRSPASV